MTINRDLANIVPTVTQSDGNIGISTSTVTNYRLATSQSTNGTHGIYVANTNTGSSASAATRYVNSGSTFAYSGLNGASRSTYATIGANVMVAGYTDSTAGITLMVDAAGPITFATGSTTTERMRIPATGGVQSVTTISVGNATPSTSGAGITFPATQSASTDANTLDDYEEGTWTPSLGGTATYTIQTGTYTKIGRFVYAQFDVSVNLIGTGSATVVSGLPFTAGSAGGGSVTYFDGIANNVVSFYPVVGGSQSEIGIRSLTSAGSGSTYTNLFQNATRIIAFVVYST